MNALHPSWLEILHSEFEKPYMQKLNSFLLQEKSDKKTIYPPSGQIFAAFDHTHFNDVKVVILGQDPYHGTGQAHGLCFSVNKGIDIPPSLRNIYKEQVSDVGIKPPAHGYLMHWADQGVLLLNATLTVRANEAGSHQKRGWEQFTDEIIKQLNDKRENIVFLLWGNYARGKSVYINRQKHLVLDAPHPSPLSAHNGFFGCRHFSATNKHLVEKGLSPIDWQIT